MKWKTAFLISISLWVLLAGTFIFLFVRGTTQKSSDGREAVILNAHERDFVLGEMRMLLKAVHQINTHLANSDRLAAAKSAREVGTAMEGAVESGHAELMTKLPLGLKQLGLATHKDMDVLADLLESGADQKQIFTQISSVTAKCTACHDQYRFAVPE
jgi:hypothetical protein